MKERRHLVVAPNWIGDTAMAAPFFASLRSAFPDAAVEVLAGGWTAGLLGSYPWVGRVHSAVAGAAGWRDALSLRRGGRYEAVWLLPNSFRSALLVRCVGADRRIGYATDGRSWLLSRAVRPPRKSSPPHLVDYYLGLLEAEGIVPRHRSVRLPVTPEAERLARELLSSGAPPGEGPVVGFHPGAAFGASKTWPPERFGALARILAVEEGARVVVFAGPGERELATRVEEESGGAAVGLAGRDTLETLPALLAGLDVFVSGDTGPLHVAALVGTPAVALFGPTDPRRTAPRGETNRVVSHGLECSPCFARTCPLGHHECMRGISPQEVSAQVSALLRTRMGGDK